MTPEEALALIDESIVRGEVVDDAYNYAFWEVVRKALEKQIPKKPAWEFLISMCPECRTVIGYASRDDDYCCACGQRILWEVKNDEA